MHDYLVVGCGLYGSVFARTMAERGSSVLLIDIRTELGGNIYSELLDDIEVHKYGPHIFHTNSDRVWKFVNRFAEFNHYRHCPKAYYKGKMYSLPFNMNTFHQLWGVITPDEAREKLAEQCVKIENPANLEEWVLSQAGPDIYEKLIYGYTKKQWQREPRELPAFIIKRLPFRFTYDDNYFDDKYQGIPIQGYSRMVENIVDHKNIELMLGTDFFEMEDWRTLARRLVYSGSIDELFDCKHGILEYRSLKFDTLVVDGNFQGTAQVNYTDESVAWTRIVEHKHFMMKPNLPKSAITFEYSKEWEEGENRYYPINDDWNNSVYEKYREEAKKQPDIIIGGRLSSFRYMNMDQVIAQALHDAFTETSSKS